MVERRGIDVEAAPSATFRVSDLVLESEFVGDRLSRFWRRSMALVAQSAPWWVEMELWGQEELEGASFVVIDPVLSIPKFLGGGTVVLGIESGGKWKSLELMGVAAPLSSLAKVSMASSEAFDSVSMLSSLRTSASCGP